MSNPPMYPVGEITYPDGHRMLIPQPVKWEYHREGNTVEITPRPMSRCGTCFMIGGRHHRDCLDDATTVILPPVEKPVQATVYRVRRPVWIPAVIVLGMALVAFSVGGLATLAIG